MIIAPQKRGLERGGQVLHAEELERLEAVEAEAGVRHHAHHGGHEPAVQGADTALLQHSHHKELQAELNFVIKRIKVNFHLRS
uniref:SFRICE_013329 n=1 Tax=Spodoptera frugiperda TaxID=7108 RepID=A0A2H1W6F8_SPOFR